MVEASVSDGPFTNEPRRHVGLKALGRRFITSMTRRMPLKQDIGRLYQQRLDCQRHDRPDNDRLGRQFADGRRKRIEKRLAELWNSCS